jgi:alanyl-tRNA synthetase
MGGPRSAADPATWSVELCGGTHVRRTGDIGDFIVIGEGAVAAGVRRVEALTGEAAQAYVADRLKLLAETASALKAAPEELPERVAILIEDRRRLERELSDLRRKLASGGAAAAAGPKQVNGVAFIGRAIDGVPARELKSMADDLKKQVGSGVVAVVGTADGKASIVVGVTDDLTPGLSAVDLVRLGAEALGGKGGGGRPDMAQAGGPDASRADAAIAAIEAALAGRSKAA